MKKPPQKSGFVLGRKAFAKISAVEGLQLSEEAKKMFEEFDRLGLSAEERRQRVIDRHTRPKQKRPPSK
jgi:hypothetical protein